KSGDLAEAKRVLLEAVHNEPKLSAPRIHLAKIFLQEKDSLRARAQCFEALRNNAFDPETYFLLGEIMAMQNELQEAIQLNELSAHLTRFGTKELTGKVWKRLGELYRLKNDSTKMNRALNLAAHYGADDLPEYDELDATELEKIVDQQE